MPATLDPPLSRQSKDQRLNHAARHALRTCGYRAISQLGCVVKDGVVILTGVLPSYFLKQVAQAAIQRLDVRGIENLVDVRHSFKAEWSMSSLRPVILVAASEPKISELCARTLGDRGFHVETASGGMDCLSKLREHRPAALVLDDDLARAGNDGVLARMQEGGAPATPTVLMGRTPQSTASTPVVATLEKPFHLDDLLDCVGRAMFRFAST